MGNQSLASEILSTECMDLLGNWVDALQAACDTAGRGSCPITVAGRLKAAAAGGPMLRSLCHELADASGLRAELTMDGSLFTVRFSKVVGATV
jgi:hypothetical protein